VSGDADTKRGGKRRRIVGGARRTPGASASRSLALDDQPRRLVLTRDGRRVLIVLPYEIWVVDARTLRFERSIELPSPEPSVAEGRDGRLWIGGRHLYAGSAFDPGLTKVGSKLGGFVDQVALLRPGLLCGVGHGGEVLYDLDQETEVHRRRVRERQPYGVTATPDERAVFCDGGPSAWMIDPAHPAGHTKLGFQQTSAEPPASEGIVAVGLTTRGRCVLAARDGAVAWTTPSLRRDQERFVPLPSGHAAPMAVAGDERWVYVLRPGGRLQRFLIAQPYEPPKAKSKHKDKDKDKDKRRGAPVEDTPDPLPEIQETRLARVATCMALRVPDDAPDRRSLLLGGPHADGMLGRLWEVDPATLEWSDVRPRPRPTIPKPEGDADPSASGSRGRPDFTPMRHKLGDDQPSLGGLAVDDVLAPRALARPWITHDRGALLERPIAPVASGEVMPLDVVVIPAMLRMREGTARPGLLLWPGAREDRDDPAPDPIWLAWGDRPRGWMPLTTPKIREQRWERGELFPMMVAIRGLPEVAGRRAKLPKRWIDADSFDALCNECRKLMKVLW
jgi:hypothetical protein